MIAALNLTNGVCRFWVKILSSPPLPKVFFGGDAAYGPKNIITAVAHGHEAAVSIDRFLNGEDVTSASTTDDQSDVTKDGHTRVELSTTRCPMTIASKCHGPKAETALASIKIEVELGFDAATAFKEASRCLNCDVQTVFNRSTCIECDGCVDICPMDCITFTSDGDEADLRTRLKAPATNADARPVCVRRAQNRTRDDQGRRCVPALRTVRRALPDRSLGYAEIPASTLLRPGRFVVMQSR